VNNLIAPCKLSYLSSHGLKIHVLAIKAIAKIHDAVGDGRLSLGAATWRTERNIASSLLVFPSLYKTWRHPQIGST